MQMEQIIGIAAGVLTSTSMLPQLIKLVKEKKSDAISPVMLIVLIIGLSFWAWYGFLRNDLPIIITNLFAWVVNVTLLVLRQVYQKRISGRGNVK
jgi:MtN3 and saliva related transmembrane protein